MKARNFLFVLFLALQTFSVSLFAVTDNIDYSALELTDDNGSAEEFSNVSFGSGAAYTGALLVEGGELLFDGDGALASVVSGGYISSITIYWGASALEGYDEITIQASKADAKFVLREVETVYCDGSSSQTISSFDADDAYITLNSGNEAHIDHIEIEWVTRVSYAIATVPDARGTITVASSAYAGDNVKVSVKRASSSYAITGYHVYQTAAPYEEVANVTHAAQTAGQTYEFEMPAYPVTIEAKYITAPTTTLLATVKDAGDNNLIALDAMTSGETLTYYYNAPSDYAGEITVSSTNTSCAQAELVRTNAYSGRLIIHPYQAGSVKITLSFSADTKYKSRNFASKIATVSARDVALVTELNDKYYAVTHSIGGTTATAQELIKEGENYYYKSGVSVSDITWQYEIANAAGTKFYLKHAGNYLTVDAATISLEAEAFQWSKNASKVFITNYLTGLCYNEEFSAFTANNQNENQTISTISAPVHEVSISNILPATEYTRSLTNGNYATMCLPFAVSASETFFSGAEVYIIVGKHVSEGNVTGIELEQVTGNLVAGKPYVILATASTLSAWHGADLVGSPVNGDGLVGNLNIDPLTMPDGTYGISGNKLRKINGGTGKVNQYRAYINLDGIPEVAATPTPAPGRRVIVTENSTESEEQQDVETSLEDLLNNATSINWNEPVYNVLGQRVGKGTTGVLIQNGKKFFVQ